MQISVIWKYLGIFVLLNSLCSCGFVHDEVLTGPYRLIAVDLNSDMSLSYDLGNGSAVGRVNETVFAVGWNDTYVVAQQHPENVRSVTHYYYIERVKDGPWVDPSACVTGPLTEKEFLQKQQELKLPAFTRIISSLK
ncbi:MAG: hypothetical protein OJI67_17125 [Prosthecobacter sp.]|nr:hypothetical protein [Prosthecobacter sp.]